MNRPKQRQSYRPGNKSSLLRFAQFGAGRIGAIHAANLSTLDGTRLLYVVDVNDAAAASLAVTSTRLPLPTVFSLG